MIIGAGTEQVPAYQLAKQRGLAVVGTDANRDAPAMQLADHQLIVSTRDPEGTAAKALELKRRLPIDGVMTIANDVPYTVARVAHALRLTSISLEAARCATDKFLMKQRFRNEGVACPWFTSVSDADQIRTVVANGDGKRFVLKPVDGRGARGVLLLDSGVDVNWAYQESKRWGESGRLILEEFVPGTQLSTESFLLGGKCFTPAIAERNYVRLEQFAPYIIEDGGTIPALLDKRQRDEIDDIVRRGAAAMGITEGVIKGDLVVRADGRPAIIELAPRLSGGWLATHQIPAASGVNLVDAVISYSLGEAVEPKNLVPKFERATAIRYWFPRSGTITEIRGEDRLRSTLGLLAYGFFRRPGDAQPMVRMHPDRFGYAIVSADSRAEALRRIETAMSSVEIGISG